MKSKAQIALLNVLDFCRIPKRVKRILVENEDSWISAIPSTDFYLNDRDDVVMTAPLMPLDDIAHDDISLYSLCVMYSLDKEEDFMQMVKKLKPTYEKRFVASHEIMALTGRGGICSERNGIYLMSWND
jgi:hypothetical protein